MENKFFFAAISILLITIISFNFNVYADITVTKQKCITTFGMDWDNSEIAKSHLLNSAKRKAVGEIFGEIIRGVTQVKNGILKKDEVELISAGLIRIDGNPLFFQGKDFGEICVKIDAYISEEDIERLKPRKIEKKVCISDPRLSLGDVRKTAEQQARIQAARNFEPKLEKVDDDKVLALIHESETIEAGFIPDTEVYCVKASGIVHPIELLAVLAKPSLSLSEDDIIIECWGNDLSDNRNGGWKSNYPNCIFDDGGGDSNAIYNGKISFKKNKLCITLENLNTKSSPSHTLAVGFSVSLKKGCFLDGSKSKEIEMTRFRGRPDNHPIIKCFDIK